MSKLPFKGGIESVAWCDVADYVITPTFILVDMDLVLTELSDFPAEEELLIAVADGVNDQGGVTLEIALAVADPKSAGTFAIDLDTDLAAGTRGILRVKARSNAEHYYFGANSATLGDGCRVRKVGAGTLKFGETGYLLYRFSIAAAEGGGTVFIGA